ncbi:MAG: ABC transporter permease [Pirellulaceae bacterium]
MGGAIGVQYLTRDQVDLTARKIGILDKTGRLLPIITEQANARNLASSDGEGDSRKQTQPEFIVETVESSTDLSDTDEQSTELELSERVRRGELFAFAIIEPGAFEAGSGSRIRYYSQSPSYQSLSSWLDGVVNAAVKSERIAKLGLAPESIAEVSQRVPVSTFGLVEKQEDGVVKDAKAENRILTFAVPFAGLMLMFMMIMSVAPAMLNNVLEEKMQKISEFLVSSLSPFQLMFGKLLGSIGVGLTLSAIYLGAVYGVAVHYQIADSIPLSLYAWFVFFLFIALVIYGSIFSAIGAACSEIRDAQSLMTPIMLLVIIPMMCMAPVLDSPSSNFSRAISLFPPATPMLMFVRIAIPPGPAIWEIVLATALVIVFAIGCVWAAGKVFRIGILAQGQTPSLAGLAKWIFTKG